MKFRCLDEFVERSDSAWDTGETRAFWVNPEHVTGVHADSGEGRTAVLFTNGDCVSVKGSVADVIASLGIELL